MSACSPDGHETQRPTTDSTSRTDRRAARPRGLASASARRSTSWTPTRIRRRPSRTARRASSSAQAGRRGRACRPSAAPPGPGRSSSRRRSSTATARGGARRRKRSATDADVTGPSPSRSSCGDANSTDQIRAEPPMADTPCHADPPARTMTPVGPYGNGVAGSSSESRTYTCAPTPKRGPEGVPPCDPSASSNPSSGAASRVRRVNMQTSSHGHLRGGRRRRRRVVGRTGLEPVTDRL
jgi:hypothetical protein